MSTTPRLFDSFIDDAALFPPGSSPMEAAVDAWQARQTEPWRDLVSSFVVTDVKLPEVVNEGIPVSVVVTGGAGGLAGVTGLVRRAGATLAGIEMTVRDLDDPTGAVRRIVAAADAARSEGTLDDDTPVYVEIPKDVELERPADVVAEAGLRLKFRTGGLEADSFPTADTLAAWIDAALDRETPFKCTAGLHRAVAHTDPESGFDHHGFLNVLVATRTALDTGDRAATLEVLTERRGEVLASAAAELSESTRRWFRSFGSCSVLEPRDDLRKLGLLDA